jgi:adenylate kinase
VPDELVVAMVRERIRAYPRFVLDGFPRTMAQAHALDRTLLQEGRELTAAVLVEAPDEVVMGRIAGRKDGRDDDEIETVGRRLEVFHRATAPIADHYHRLGVLHRIDASRKIAEVYADARLLLMRLAEEARTAPHRKAP